MSTLSPASKFVPGSPSATAMVRIGSGWCGFAAACALALASVAASAASVIAPAADAAQAGMLDVATLAADIEVDIRYAGDNNFTGQPVPGYEAGKCLLLAPVAQALARAQRALRQQGYGLRIYDCYRPVRAVHAFVAWARDPATQSSKARYYPALEKDMLLGDYIAESSGHSRGATVDLTLLDCRDRPCRALDMGTEFDFFDPRANTDSMQVGAQQRQHRQQLLQALRAQGFVNYPLEWWHYTFSPEPSPRTAYDFPIR